MNFVTAVFSQVGQVFNAQTAGRKLVLLMVIMGTMIAMVMLTLYAQSGGYVVVYSNLTQTEAAAGVGRLAASKINARMEKDGTAIAVPASRQDEARVLLMEEGISSSGTVGYEAMDKTTLGQSRRMEDRNYHRVREGELTRTLMSIQEVERARVHLALPENSLYVDDEQKATASIALKLRHNAQLTERQINGIVHLVASSVENLKPENVTIIDQSGNLLNTPGEQNDGMHFTATQVQFKSGYEEETKKRIESMLEKIVGPGRVVARVQSDFDFSTSREVNETYNPDEQDPIKRTESVTQEGRSHGAGTQGAPGSSSNLPGQENAAVAGGATGTDSRMNQTVEYDVSRKWQEKVSSMPRPTRISVGILVDGVYEKTTDAGGVENQQFRTRTPDEMATIEDMVKMAIGYTATDTRQDQVTVACAPFQLQELDAPDTFTNSYNFQRYVDLGIRWGVLALLGLLMILFVLKPAVSGIMVTQAQVTAAGALPLGPGIKPGTMAAALAAGTSGGVNREGAGAFVPGSAYPDDDDENYADEAAAIKAKAAKRAAAREILMHGNMILDQVQSQGKETQILSKVLQDETLSSAKENPEKTVSLMRHWMEET